MRQPNVVVCLCDQLRAFEAGCYGNPVIRTPHIDRLAREGVRFDVAVTNDPVCMPARSSLLTGQYARTCTGRLHNYEERDAHGRATMPEYPVRERAELTAPTLPEQFRSMGYDTALVGKWHLHPAPDLVGFDVSVFPRNHHRYTGQTFVRNAGNEERVDGFSADFETERLNEFLGSRSGRPFFLYYNISPPHMPLLDIPERYRTLYSPESIPLRPNVYVDGKEAYDEHWFKIYLWDFLYYQENEPTTTELPEGFDLRRLLALYYGATAWTDHLAGRLMRSLQTAGVAENTVVVFLSDHGDNLGSHHRFNKDLLIEESIRIPMIFHAPGLWGPRVNDTQVAQIIDVMPTLLDLCGAETPPTVQGRSLARMVTAGDEAPGDRDAFIETAEGLIGLRTPTHMYGMRLGDDLRTIEDERYSFHDLRDDPYEQVNLARTDVQADTAGMLRQRLRQWNARTPWLSS